MRIAINGMGRIGRLLFRRLTGHPDIEIVAVNDIMPPANLGYLIKYDSVYGTCAGVEYVAAEQELIAGGKRVKVLQEAQPLNLPWKQLNVDVVLECAGLFSSLDAASQHLKAGAGRVLLSTTGSPDIPLMIFGHNHKQLENDPSIVSPGGCMTNCSTHILYILQTIGIESAQATILHSYTSRQELVDTPHKQFRRGRAAAESIIPVEIDLPQSLERLMPGLKNRFAAVSIRVPVANGALADFSIQMKEDVTAAQINALFRRAASEEYKGIIDYTEEELVSLDIKGNTHSCIIDGTLTSVIGRQLKVVAWFDNEYGFTSRMIDWLEYWKR